MLTVFWFLKTLFFPLLFSSKPMIATMKYILVTGGVISGIGKGIIASSVGTILKSCGLHVTAIKIDPYINIDAGTFSPYEHGKVKSAHNSVLIPKDTWMVSWLWSFSSVDLELLDFLPY